MKYTKIEIKDLIRSNHISKDQHAIYDYKFQTNMRDAPWYKWLNKPGYFECKDEYITEIHKWIHSTELNTIKGLENYPIRDMIIGTTQAFDEAYYEFKGKTLRIFRGEYGYHKRIFGENNTEYLDSETGDYIGLNKNDWVILSQPFCGTGEECEHLYTMLDDALEKNVPVLIDCAWLGTCKDINFDFRHPAITYVCFSISKGIGLGNMRSGIRYSRKRNEGIINFQNDYNHLVLISAQIGIHQMKTFSPDFIPNKYYNAYIEVCKDLDVKSTKCMHMAIAPFGEYWNEFINGRLNKIGIRKLVKEKYKCLR